MRKLLYDIWILFIGLPVILVSTILTAIFTSIGSILIDRDVWGYLPGRLWGKTVCRGCLLPVTIKGRERLKEGVSYVFVANHQSAFDIWIIYGYIGRNFKWMMKQAIRYIPLVGKACEDAGQVYVDRSSPAKIQETMDKARGILKGGMSLMVFCEGTRSDDGRLQPFKKGAFQLADELGMQIVPISINGAYDVLPKGGRWIHYHPLSMTLHEPISPIGKGPKNVRHMMLEAREAIISGLEEKYRPLD